MSWTQVQKKIVSGTAAQSAVPFDSNVTQGNLILAIPGMNVAGQTTLPTVSGLTLAEERLGTNCGIGIWYARVASTGPLSIQASGLSGSYSLAIAEYSHSAVGNPVLDKHTDNAASSTTTVGVIIPVISSADELVVVAARTSGATTAPRSWSNAFNEQADMNSRGSWATILASSATSFATGYSWTGTLNGVTSAATFMVDADPVANNVKVRLLNAFASYPLKVRLSNAWVTVT